MTNTTKTVLIIDDEPDVREYLSALFEDNGYATQTAKDGADGLAKVKENPPDLVTLDVTMPERSGIRCYRDLKESDQYKHIPIIIVTGVSKSFEQFISSRSQVPPPDGYVSKPIDRDEILALAKSLVGA